MDSLDSIRERLEALEQQTKAMEVHTHTVERRLRRWRIMWRVVAVAALALVLAIPHSVQAKTFHCGTGDAACLITAINTANANGKANTITLKAGTYTLTAVDNMTAGPNGLPSLTSPLTIIGVGAPAPSIERDASAPLFRILHVAATGTLRLEKLTIKGGAVPQQRDAGGVLNDGGTVIITDSTIVENRAVFGGGGGLVNSIGTMTITNSTIAHNDAVSSGGLGNGNGGTVTISHSVIEDNHASAAGGGLFNCGGVVTITNSTIARNQAGSEAGGGLVNTCDGRMTISNSAIADNQADESEGGGLSNDLNGVVTIMNSTIAGNRAQSFGGGLVNGDHFNGGPGTLTIINTTISGNTAGSGGGLGHFIGTVVLQNTILARNTAKSSGPDCLGLIASGGNNLIGTQEDCDITLQPSDLTGDPGLDTFKDNSKPGNGHFPLLPTSQAINAGNDAFCPPTDQLGQRRVGPCDIGAIEFQGKHHK